MDRRSLLKMLAGLPLLGGWLERPTTFRVPEWDADVGMRPLDDREVVIPFHLLRPRPLSNPGLIQVKLKLDCDAFMAELERVLEAIRGR